MYRTLLLLLLFLIGFAWICILLMLFLGYRIKVRYSYPEYIGLNIFTYLATVLISVIFTYLYKCKSKRWQV